MATQEKIYGYPNEGFSTNAITDDSIDDIYNSFSADAAIQTDKPENNTDKDAIDTIYESYSADAILRESKGGVLRESSNNYPNEGWRNKYNDNKDSIDDISNMWAANGLPVWGAEGIEKWKRQVKKADGLNPDTNWLHSTKADGLSTDPNWLNSSWLQASGWGKFSNWVSETGTDVLRFIQKYEPYEMLNRNAILAAIELNIGAAATKLYPAIATNDEVLTRKIKLKYVTTAIAKYNEVRRMYYDLGGSVKDLNGSIKIGERVAPVSLDSIVNGNKREIAYYYDSQIRTLGKATFDWVGNGDFGDNKAAYANLHVPEFSNFYFKIEAGDEIEIKQSDYAPMQNVVVRVLKVNKENSTILIDYPALPVNVVVTGSFNIFPAYKTGIFDFVYKEKIGDKEYAALHCIAQAQDSNGRNYRLKVGDTLKIVNTDWTDLEGKFVKIIKLLLDKQTIVINEPAIPAGKVYKSRYPDGQIKGVWEQQVVPTANIKISFDWVGKGDYDTKKNYYAALHIAGNYPNINLVEGDVIEIIDCDYKLLKGVKAKILKVNKDAGTIVIDTPAPETNTVISGGFNISAKKALDYAYLADWIIYAGVIVSCLPTILKLTGITGEVDEQIYDDPAQNKVLDDIKKEDANNQDIIEKNKENIAKAQGAALAGVGDVKIKNDTSFIELLQTDIGQMKKDVEAAAELSPEQKTELLGKLNIIQRKKIFGVSGIVAGVALLATIIILVTRK